MIMKVKIKMEICMDSFKFMLFCSFRKLVYCSYLVVRKNVVGNIFNIYIRKGV